MLSTLLVDRIVKGPHIHRNVYYSLWSVDVQQQLSSYPSLTLTPSRFDETLSFEVRGTGSDRCYSQNSCAPSFECFGLRSANPGMHERVE